MTQRKEPDFSKYNLFGFVVYGFHFHLQKSGDLRKDIAVYYGKISMMDKYIGRILDKLKELELEEDTIVIFTSDHGYFLGQHGLIRKGPFHYEDMIRLSFIVKYNGVVPKNIVNHSMQSLVDLIPTFLSFLEEDIPRNIKGDDQSEVWRGEVESKRNHIIVENRHEDISMNLRTYVDDRYKMTVYYGEEYGELFDLEKDLDELNNIWKNEK